MSNKCTVSYFEENGVVVWKCQKYLSGTTCRIPLTRDKCYVYNCPGRNAYTYRKENTPPIPTIEIIETHPNETRMCEAAGCSQILERECQLKFCSRKCGNRDRQQKARARKKQAQTKAPR
jgi:hypothetical protein